MKELGVSAKGSQQAGEHFRGLVRLLRELLGGIVRHVS